LLEKKNQEAFAFGGIRHERDETIRGSKDGAGFKLFLKLF